MGNLGYFKQEALNIYKRHRPKRVRFPEIEHALKTRGVCTVPNFMTADQCANLRAEIDRLMVEYKEQVRADEVQSDLRIFGANRVSKQFNDFYFNEFIRAVVADYEGGEAADGFVMAARMEYKPGNQGSGNGWHRDSAHFSQTKSILYLSDAKIENGPFQYVIGSHLPSHFIQGWLKGLYQHEQFRFTEEEIQKYLDAFPLQKLETFPAPAGTLIFADTRGLHRGMPIQQGTRYAVTNYFYVDKQPPVHLLKLQVN